MNKSLLALVAGAALTATSAAQADSITFDLSNYVVGSPFQTFGVMAAPAGTVTSVEWNITYSSGSPVGSISWASELQIELVAPGFAPNTVTGTGAGADPGGSVVGVGNPGTFVWGTSGAGTWSPSFTPDFDFGWPNTSSSNNSAGSTNALNGLASGGNWTLNILDSYNDTAGGVPAQGMLVQGSFITINYDPVPAPGVLALLGLAGVVSSRRRRS